MSESISEQWLSDWCQRALAILRNWEEWALTLQQAMIGSPASTVEKLVGIGQQLSNDLHLVMLERQQALKSASAVSVRQLVMSNWRSAAEILKQVRAIETLAVRVRQLCAAQWVSAKQSANFVEELLYIFRSGQSAPATYSSDEQDAFQGGFVLDSTA